jgi:hypothetical protein
VIVAGLFETTPWYVWVAAKEPSAAIAASANWNSPLRLPPGAQASEVATVTSCTRVPSGDT